MDNIINFVQNLSWMEWVIAIQSACAGLIPIFLLIKGDQPEKTLQKIVDLISKISRK